MTTQSFSGVESRERKERRVHVVSCWVSGLVNLRSIDRRQAETFASTNVGKNTIYAKWGGVVQKENLCEMVLGPKRPHFFRC